MKTSLKFTQLLFSIFLTLLLINSGSVLGQVAESYVIEDCGGRPCVMTSTSKKKMPVPCNCIPKISDVNNIQIQVKSSRSELIGAKIVTASGQIYASTDKASGGKVTYDATTGNATLQFGIVNKSLSNSKLKVIFTTFESNGSKNEFNIEVGQ